MSGERIIGDHLREMLEHARKARRFVEGMSFESFGADERTCFATIRPLEVLGEAARSVPPAFRDRHASVPRRQIIGLRDRLIHGDKGVNHDIVWRTIPEELPVLEPQLDQLLSETEDL